MASGRGRAETLTSVHSTLRESFLASDLAENHQIPRNLAGLTLASILNNDRKSAPNSNVVRTLLDIMRTEETLSNQHPTRHHFTGKNSWKSFKDRLKLRRSVSNSTSSNNVRNIWISAAPVPATESEMVYRNSLRSSSTQRADSFAAEDEIAMRENGDQESSGVRLSDSMAAEREGMRRLGLLMEMEGRRDADLVGVNGGDEPIRMSSVEIQEPANRFGEGGEVSMRLSDAIAAEREGVRRVRLLTEMERGRDDDLGGADGGDEPIRMSLMEFLEDTDGSNGIQGPDDDEGGEVQDDDNEEEEEEGEGGAGVTGEVGCCVCMVRHKGAAFIPCGHTFCRVCSRELWVKRGHCPLCNSFILEILDIF